MTATEQPVTFGEYVRRLRRAKGWTAVTAADATGIASTHLSRVENDKLRPNAETVAQLHNALGGDLVEMLRLAACIPMEIMALLGTQPDRKAMGYAASGQQDKDLAFAVRRISEFARRYQSERNEYRGQVWTLEERVRELEERIGYLQDADEKAGIWCLRAERWKETARAYRDVLMLFYHPRNVPYMLRLGRKYRKAKA